MRELYFYHQLEDMFEEMLNERYEPINICTYEHEQGTALRGLDPVAFRYEIFYWMNDHYIEVEYKDMTDDEREKYYASESNVMYTNKGMNYFGLDD